MHKIYLSVVVMALMAGKAEAAGFEKSVMWSGKYAGAAGSDAVGGVTGSQSLFFNPAGLAKNGDASVNYSPTWLHVNGYLASATSLEDTDKDYITSGDVSASYVFSDRFGIGAAAYVVGGERAVYNDVSLAGDNSNISFTPTLKTDLAITEYAFGAGAEVMPGLRVGAAWRITKANGSLASIQKTTANSAYIYSDIEDAQDTRYKGFKVGAQYEDAGHLWGAGLTYRNGVTFNAHSTNTRGSTVIIANNTQAGAAVTPVDLSLTLPAQVAFGGWYRLNDNFKVMAGVDMTHYSTDQMVQVNGTINLAGIGGSAATPLPSPVLGWNDMWNLRIGGEYLLGNLALRAGYSHTNQVTSSVNAKATIAPAGTGHLITVGAGTSVMKNFDIDGALEYAWNHGNGSMTATPAGITSQEILAGKATDTSARSLGIHTGFTYRF